MSDKNTEEGQAGPANKEARRTGENDCEDCASRVHLGPCCACIEREEARLDYRDWGLLT